jgi:hypothetical protein
MRHSVITFCTNCRADLCVCVVCVLCVYSGGIAGHAGLFSTISDISAFASYMLQTHLGQPGDVHFLNTSTVTLFTSIFEESFSSRALGWTTNAGVS